MLKTLTFALLIALSAPARATSQISLDSARAAALARLRPGEYIRLAYQDGQVSGEVVALNDGVLVLSRYGKVEVVTAHRIEQLWVAEGKATGTGAFVGGLILGGVGVPLGWFFGGFMCESSCLSSTAYGATVGAIGGFLAGAIVGGTIGSLMPNWRKRFP